MTSNPPLPPPQPANPLTDLITLITNQKPEEPKLPAPLTSHFRTFLEFYTDELQKEKLSFTPINVDEIASHLSRFYEMVRKVIDWKEDNALRRGAISRILKRILFPYLSGLTPELLETSVLAETITLELIRGGHLPNNAIPQERITLVAESLEKYLTLISGSSLRKTVTGVKTKINYTTFILEIAVCEIEEILTHPVKEYALMSIMTDLLDDRIKIKPANAVSEVNKRKYIFIAVCRTLYDLDDNFISYKLLKQLYPYWHQPSPDQIHELGQNLPHLWRKLSEELDSPALRKFVAVAERIDTAFVLIDDFLDEFKDRPADIIPATQDKEKFTEIITSKYEKRFKTLKTRLFRLAIFSTLSVFLSNWVTFFIVEVPLAHIFYEGFNTYAAVADFLIPTTVMFLLVIIIRPPNKKNLGRVLSTTLGFVYEDEKQENYQIRMDNNRHMIFRVLSLIIYILTTLLVFYVTAAIFIWAQLPMTSVIFDTFTIALTVFAAVTIRNKSKELSVNEQTTVYDFFLDMFSVPIAKVGSVLAAKWKEYNVVAILFNFLIEMPFTLILDFIEHWSEFIKERRAELH
jgi:hypothetical protein